MKVMADRFKIINNLILQFYISQKFMGYYLKWAKQLPLILSTTKYYLFRALLHMF